MIPAVLSALMRMTAAALAGRGWALLVTAISLVVGLLANYALVFGHFGLPALGLRGSALASVTVSVTATFAYA